MIKAIFFDVDGVLVDSFEANAAWFKEMFETTGYIAPTKEEYRHMFHIALDDMIRLVAKPDAKEFKRVREISKRIPFPFEKMKLTKGAEETLKKLAKKYKLAIVTGRDEHGVEELLTFYDLKKYFDIVVHYGHYENPKPHPEPLLKALERLEIHPNEAVYVGDQKTDFESAKAAKIPFILHSEYDYKLKGVKLIAKKFTDIPALIGKI